MSVFTELKDEKSERRFSMARMTTFVLVAVWLGGSGFAGLPSAAAQDGDIWKAAASGNIETIKQHLKAGIDVDAKESPGGSTPLLVAAAFGQVETVKFLIEKGANVKATSNDGATALHGAAFFCRTEIVKLLLEKGAVVDAKNARGETPLISVAGEWSEELEGVYRWIAEILGLQLNLERIKATRPKIAALLQTHQSKIAVDIWTAVRTGNIGAIKRHIAAGTNVNAAEPEGGSTPLIIAAMAGQGKAVDLLIESGARVNAPNNDGSTALLVAAFFGHTEIVKSLLAAGADVNARNQRGETALDTVDDAWSEPLEGIYQAVAGALQLDLDLERIKTARPKITGLLRKAKAASPRKQAATESGSTGYRGSYFKNGEIHVNTYGTPEGKSLTSGHQDFKPSWSKTGDMLVFFRRLKNHRVTVMWKTQIHIINVDGTGLHALTDGTHTDFNQTWTRDGTNTPIWNRKNPATGSFYVMASKVGNKPGEEVALTDKRYHTWAYTCLMDGRILVQCAHPQQGHGYYLMTPNDNGKPRFERIDCDLAKRGILDRVSISPSETRVCFEYQTGFKYKDAGRTLYIADFDAKKPSITNAKAFANEARADRWFAYPRWTKDEKAIVYHASPSLYLYTLKDGSTRKVSTTVGADYRYPHMEAAPK